MFGRHACDLRCCNAVCRGMFDECPSPTFWQLRDQLQLTSLFATDARLQNTYALIAPGNNRQAAAFVQWLASDKGMARVSSFTIDGKRAYELWPIGGPGARPVDRPCRPRQ